MHQVNIVCYHCCKCFRQGTNLQFHLCTWSVFMAEWGPIIWNEKVVFNVSYLLTFTLINEVTR